MLPESIVLIAYDNEDDTKEAISLCNSAGYNVSKVFRHKNLKNPKYGLSNGKAEELKEYADVNKVDAVVFDSFLKPSQNYNLASLVKKTILDRESLILEIFNKRAISAESQLQVKLAQLRYEMPRAKEKVRLAKKGEQPGFLGIGKYGVDVYYNDIKNRMYSVKTKLAKAGKQRALHRESRKRIGFKTVSLAGYTSSGKSTLFSRLTGEDAPQSSDLFTTLSTTVRKTRFEKTDFLVSDTVGFINNLPTYMIEAFKSTLEELIYSDLVILVVDVSDSITHIRKKMKSCLDTLNEIGVSADKILFVLNKSDKLSEYELSMTLESLGFHDNKNNLVTVSALRSKNIKKLKRLIVHLIENERNDYEYHTHKNDTDGVFSELKIYYEH